MEQEDDIPERQTYYITTAIDYPNALPHIGHALEKVIADVIARYHRLIGDDTFFSTGIDENSQHVARAAKDNGVDAFTWVARMNEAFRLAWAKLDISYDWWMRTTSERHTRASQEMFRRALANGDIYRAVYAGWYCPNCNMFYTGDELIDGHCPIHPTIIPEWLEEDNYFFALTKYAERLQAHIEAHPNFIVPVVRSADVLGMLRQGLRDFPVSRVVRANVERWGIPIPEDSQQVLYVWFDALTNYLTAVGFPDDMEKFARYWPADAHVIGKDITRFHCLYWPAMLLSADLPLPKQIAVHGFTTLEGQRISKTTGNTIDPVELVDAVGVDAVRYYLLRTLSFASDGDFSRAGLVQHYNNELGNDLGNLLNRVVSMIGRYRGGTIPTAHEKGALEEDVQRVAEEARRLAPVALNTWDISGALNIIWNLVRRANQYIEQSKPWELARLKEQPEQQERLDTVLYTAAEATRLCAVLLAPFIPSSSNRILAQLGLPAIEGAAWVEQGTWGSGVLTHVLPGPVVFPRIEAL